MIIFRELEIEGFGSILKPLTFRLDNEGLNVLRGRVGSGKTTIPSALSWCLYGQTLKEKSNVASWEEIRDKNFRGTKVSTTFEKGPDTYTIIRCENFKGKVGKQKGGNRIIILLNGEDVVKLDNPLFKDLKGKKEQQALIEKLIGYSFDLFKSSIIFGQKMKKIIEETGPKKKKIFEEAFDAGFIEEAKNNEKDELKKLDDLFEKIENKIDNAASKLVDKREIYKDALSDEKNFEKEKKKRIKELSAELEEYKEELVAIPKTLTPNAISNLEKKVEKIEKAINKGNEHNRKLKEEQQKLLDIRSDYSKLKKKLKLDVNKCPECGTDLSKEKREKLKKKYKGELKSLKKEIKLYEAALQGWEKQDIEELKSRLHQQRRILKEKEAHNVRVEMLIKKKPKLLEKIENKEKEIKALEKKKLKVKSTKYKKQISKLENTISKQKKRRRSIYREIKIKKWLINDPLSNNGIKAYIFSSLLGNVNNKLEEYSAVLGFKVEFGIDLSTHNKDFYQAILHNDIVIPYQDLSGGQKQLVDTSIAFAIHDVISSIRPSNLMFMDEPFEGLGDEEIELVEELIEQKAKGKAFHLITHHKSFNPRNANEIIFKLRKNLTTKII